MIGPSSSLEIAESYPRQEAEGGLYSSRNQRPSSHRQPPVGRAREALGEEAARLLGKEAFRTRNRSVRRLTKELHRIALRKGEKAEEELREAYRKLVRVTRASCAQARRVASTLRERTAARAQCLVDSFERFVPLVEQGIDQAVRRVLEGEQVPAAEKILSLFEPHTMIITRRKVGKPR